MKTWVSAGVVLNLICASAFATEACESWTKREWLGLRDRYVQSFFGQNVGQLLDKYIADPNTQDREVLRFLDPHLHRDQRNAAATLKKCASGLAANGLDACFKNFREYVLAQDAIAGPFSYIGPDAGTPMDSPDYGYAFAMGDREYLAKLPKEIFEFPREIHSRKISDWKAMAVAKKIPYVEFTSQLDAEHRFIFWESLEKYDRYLLVMPDRDSIDVILMEKNGVSPRMYFVELTKKTSAYRGEALVHNNMQPCFRCHVSGPRVIHPKPGTLRTSFLPGVDPENTAMNLLADARLRAINANISKHSIPNWHGMVPIAQHGPTLDKNRVRDCSECHNGFEKNDINDAFYRYEVIRKVYDEGTMPPGSRPLAEPQRRAVLHDIFGSRQEDMKKWLTGEACPL